MSFVVAIDPGFSGAAVSVHYLERQLFLQAVLELPFQKLPVGRVLDARAFGRWLDAIVSTVPTQLTVVIERAQAMPRQGVSSAFQYGRGFGAIEAICLARSGIRIEWVSPAKWKRAMRLPADKRAAMNLASAKYGREVGERFWPTLSRNGVAEAALIAAYWMERP